MNLPLYKFYATLLDSFQYYLNSESDSSFREFINKVNRLPFESEAAKKGAAFNELVDTLDLIEVTGDEIEYNGFKYSVLIAKEMSEYLKPALKQVYVEALLQTSKGGVLLYGYADAVCANKVYDLKTTSSYEFPKYTNNWQHIVYPYCFNQNGILVDEFEYAVTDFRNTYRESYSYGNNQVDKLKSFCEHLIAFLEENRELITDKKVFALI